jgi:predicted AAA+ superfamily ATPase
MCRNGIVCAVTSAGYTPRLIDDRLAQLFSELPAMMLTGPRASGKTTTARRHAATVVRLDREDEASAFRLNPDSALAAQSEPVLLDEWQVVPKVLGAVKRSVDDDPRPGRFLLTGSVRGDLEAPTWPGTGRVVPMTLYGLCEREIQRRIDGSTFVERLAAGQIERFTLPPEVPDVVGYIELALRGGFPEPVLRRTGESARAWLDGYLRQLLTRDAEGLDGPRDPARLRRYFEALALNSAGLVDHKTLYDAAGIDRKTGVAYERLLMNLFVLDALPAWTSNRLARLVRASKRYLVDSSLVATALDLDLRAVLRSGDLIGRLIDTFVVAQLRPELELRSRQPRLYHVRERDARREVDLVLEVAAQDLVAIEIKATSAPSRDDARHLMWLRDQLGDRFLAGAVLHTGPRPFQLAERVLALPICCLWG